MNHHAARINTKTLTAVMAIAVASAFSQTKADAQADNGVERSVAGVWTVTITPRFCDTDMPIPGAAFESLFTFHGDGTMSVWAQNSFITVTRSPSQGLWKRDSGWSDYSLKFVHLRYDISGSYIGKQEAAGTLALSDSGDEFTTEGSTTFFDSFGFQLGAGCSSSVGTRFELDP